MKDSVIILAGKTIAKQKEQIQALTKERDGLREESRRFKWYDLAGFCLLPNKQYWIAYGHKAEKVRLTDWDVKYKIFSYSIGNSNGNEYTVALSEVKYIMEYFEPEMPDTGEYSGEANIANQSLNPKL